MNQNLWYIFMKALPKRALSRMAGRLMALQSPRFLVRWMISAFAKVYRIRLDEAEFPLEHYQSVAQLFTRRLKQGVRPEAEEKVLHPVDGVLSLWGEIQAGQAIQVKGQNYLVGELLKDEAWARDLEGGHFFNYYLCPTDYHRVHSPVSAQIERALHVAGELWPVNDISVKTVPKLFVQNERVVVRLLTDLGPVAYVMVGATNVGQMSLTFDPSVVTNLRGRKEAPEAKYWPPIQVKKAQELGCFHMGSTVVVFFPPGFLKARGFDPQELPAKLPSGSFVHYASSLDSHQIS